MAAGRKLFLTHAGELAHRLMRDVEHDGLVAGFVRTYAERYGRYGLLGDAERLPDLESTIGREALLVMAADLRRILPQAFTPGPRGMLRADDAAFVEAFYVEFLGSLERGLNRASGDSAEDSDSEGQMFRRDLEMYRRWGQRPAPAEIAGAGGTPAAPAAGESPFRDRCALLLDPAMMEQARGEAADFEKEILRAAAQRFRQLGRFGRLTAKAPERPVAGRARPRVTKAPRQKVRNKPPRKMPKKRPKKSLKKVTKKEAKRVPGKGASRSAKSVRRKGRKLAARRKASRG